VRGAGTVKLKSGTGLKGSGPPPQNVSIQDMITEIKAKFDISDEEALYIREVTEAKTKDPGIQATVYAHREDRFYLDGLTVSR
jgi:type I restriction enzyme R subunit